MCNIFTALVFNKIYPWDLTNIHMIQSIHGLFPMYNNVTAGRVGHIAYNNNLSNVRDVHRMHKKRNLRISQ